MDRKTKPEDRLSPTFEQERAFNLILNLEEAWKEDGNPIHAVRAYLIASDAGMYPPEWVLAFIEGGFRSWYDGSGTISMDKAMGLTGRGKKPAFKEHAMSGRDYAIRLSVWMLIYLGFSLKEAARMEQSRLQAEEKTFIDEKRIMNICAARPPYKGKPAHDGLEFENMTSEDKDYLRIMLRNYPFDSWPDRLKEIMK